MPEVMRFIGTGDPWPPLLAEDVARAERRHWEQHGFGWRAAIDKADGRGIGLVSLNYAGEGTAGLDPERARDRLVAGARRLGEGARLRGRRGAPRRGLRGARDAQHHRPHPARRTTPRSGSPATLGMEFDFATTGRSGERLVVYRMNRP